MSTNTISTVKISEGDTYTVKVSDTGLKGRPGIVWRGEWDETTKYYNGDVVKFNGSAWINSAYIDANATAFPNLTPDHWTLFSEKGNTGDPSVTVSATAPIGSCEVSSYTDQASCEAAGKLWQPVTVGDLWFDLTVGRLYSRVEDAQGDEVWFDISGVVGTMGADSVVVAAEGDLPGGTLQEVLQHLEDEIFKQASAPTGSTVEEGDLWYDTTNDQMKFFRNGVWETIVQTDAIGVDSGYDDITMNGGYF